MERNERRPGEEVGGYMIERTLGAGASGTVYRAVDGGGQAVALKVLHRSLAATDEARERLVREVAAMRRVDDAAFVTVLDAEVDADEAFVVTELVDGPSLEDEVLGGGPLDAEDVLELAEKLAHALRAVHAADLVHRDVKPSNVLLAEHGPVLIDFGIAQAVSDARVTSHGFVMGTPGYLAPEQLDGADPSPAGDWWGWAAALAFAVTGRAPFGVRPLEAVLGRVRAGDVDLAGAGPLTAAALRGALAADPAARTSPDDVLEALRAAVEADERHSAVTVPLAVGHATRPVDDAPAEPDDDVVEREGTGPYGPGAGPRVTTSPAPVNDGSTAVLRVPTGAFGPAPDAAPSGEPTVPLVAGTAVLPAGEADDAGLPWSTGDADDADEGAADDGAEPHDLDAVLGLTPADDADDVDEPPVHPRRPVALLALALPAAFAVGLFPVVALGVLLVLVVLVRSVGVTSDALRTRRAMRGRGRADGVRATVAYPWYLLLSVLATLPALLVALAVAALLGGPLWWLLQTNRAVVSTHELGDRGHADLVVPAEGTLNATWVFVAALALVGLVVLLLLWFGPLSWATRLGARTVLAHLAPGRGGTVFVVVVALALVGVGALLVGVGMPILWSPLDGPPNLR